MGVNGLWTVVQPCARPTNLATLNRKRIAVDASIWIYQFLKAVRDKQGNALRNSHVIGFFRRICKLLWFGIQPVFVFDGGAPALKRATIQRRQRRREGRREDAVRTAGRLLALQMRRLAAQEEERRARADEGGFAAREALAQREDVPDESQIAYAAETGMTPAERVRARRFHKQDAYHLPELEGGIAAMGKPDDPRIMSVEELDEYARQFHNGQDVNLYDFGEIDFDGDFFKSLPAPDRYNILNAARLRSRLRMGLSKDQLDDMFPDRMAFSRFQIERAKERNHLTQRLMYEVGMTGLDLTLGVNARVAGEKDREYILVKNEGVEGGWALGVVSKEKDVGEAHKPIDVDAMQVEHRSEKEVDEDEEDDADFEDVPIEGLNRLPKPRAGATQAARDIAARRQQCHHGRKDGAAAADEGEGSLFVDGSTGEADGVPRTRPDERAHPEEEDDLNRAIALSLKNQHEPVDESDKEQDDDLFEGVPLLEPAWKQEAVDAPRPVLGTGGSMIAHAVNNRANAAVPKRKEEKGQEAGGGGGTSDSDDDIQALLAKSRAAAARAQKPKPVVENKKNPFDGPLPFPKLDWGSWLPDKKSGGDEKKDAAADGAEPDDDMAGGFEVNRGAEARDEEAPRPLPPWLADESDVRESVKRQQDAEREFNAEDRMEAEAEERLRRREMLDRAIEIDSSSDDDEGSLVEVVQGPGPVSPQSRRGGSSASESPEPVFEDVPVGETTVTTVSSAGESSVLREAKGVPAREASVPDKAEQGTTTTMTMTTTTTATTTSTRPAEAAAAAAAEAAPSASPAKNPQAHDDDDDDDDDPFADLECQEFSDPEDEELLAQMATEAEAHARFASELNSKPTQPQPRPAQDADYERQLGQLRTQHRKDRRDADQVTHDMVAECQALLRLFGIPYMTAPMEAEAQCAELVRQGAVDGIVTDDSDTFLFGGTRVYKNMFNGNRFVECYLGGDLERELSLSRSQLISLAQLLGSDYTEGLSGVGPVTAVEILSEFPGEAGLDHFRDWWTSAQTTGLPPPPPPPPGNMEDGVSPTPSPSFRRRFHKAHFAKLLLPPGFPDPAVREAYLRPRVDSSTEPFRWGVPDLPGLRAFLTSTIGWGQERTDEVLVPVIRDMNRREAEGTQSNITRFFAGTVGVGAAAPPARRAAAAGRSKRMAAAVEKLRGTKRMAAAAAEKPRGTKRMAAAAAEKPRGTKRMAAAAAEKPRGTKRMAAAAAEKPRGHQEEEEEEAGGRRR